MNRTINNIAVKQHKWVESKNWHNKLPLEYLALIASEVGEAINECRGEVPTNKLGFELADIVLRTLDFAIEMGIDIEDVILIKMSDNLTRDFTNKLK